MKTIKKDKNFTVNASLVHINNDEHNNSSSILKKIYDDSITPAINGAKFCINFLTHSVKPYMYEKIKESEYRIKEIDTKLDEKYKNIPDEDKVDPRISILGPSIEILKYNLDEEHIRNMFINILAGEMDNRKQAKILPAYPEIIRQLSSEDADCLKSFSKLKRDIVIMYFDAKNIDTNEYINLDQIIVCGHHTYLKSKKIVLENLERLKIIQIHEYKSIPKLQETCDFIFDIKKHDYQIKDNQVLRQRIGTIEITDFGKDFIDICCS